MRKNSRFEMMRAVGAKAVASVEMAGSKNNERFWHLARLRPMADFQYAYILPRAVGLPQGPGL
jgi:hypothetical protein